MNVLFWQLLSTLVLPAQVDIKPPYIDGKQEPPYEIAHVKIGESFESVLIRLKKDAWNNLVARDGQSYVILTKEGYIGMSDEPYIEAHLGSATIKINFLVFPDGQHVSEVEYIVDEPSYAVNDVLGPVMQRYGWPCYFPVRLNIEPLKAVFCSKADHNKIAMLKKKSSAIRPEEELDDERISFIGSPDYGFRLKLIAGSSLIADYRKNLEADTRRYRLSHEGAPNP